MVSKETNTFYFINKELDKTNTKTKTKTKMFGLPKHSHLFKIMNSSKFIRISLRSHAMTFNKKQYLWQENTIRAIKDLLNFFCAYVQIFKT